MSVRRVIQLLSSGRLETLYKGLIEVKRYEDFVLLDYSRECQYSAKWDEVTVCCRGLIVDTRDWSVAALPFSKFFNLEEREETKVENLPKISFRVTEKIDGSLGILWRDRSGTPRIATRGGFESDQAKRGTELLHAIPNLSVIPAHLTLLFEIVYSENKTVIKYPFDGLVLLAVMDRWNQREMSFDSVVRFASALGLRTPQVYPFTTMQEAIANARVLPKTKEGYVVRFSNGLRVKLKSDWYREMHRMFWQFSDARVRKALCDGVYQDFIRDLPEELREEAQVIAEEVVEDAERFHERCMMIFREASKDSHKEFALWLRENVDPRFHGPLYQIFSGEEFNWVEAVIKYGKWEE